ncbi:MAG TPA: type II toxin-antitoxin system HicA family toxin [Thermoanaerobaculia bacterium]|nr:type II toxin-antitoxin system HicA family toxin [Thermoanaerobaculia bacterium]
MARPYTFRELVKKLRKYDRRFEVFVNRGKGSERIIYHPDINGRSESHPVKFHGEKTELRKGVLSSIIRRFDLPRDLL